MTHPSQLQRQGRDHLSLLVSLRYLTFDEFITYYRKENGKEPDIETVWRAAREAPEIRMPSHYLKRKLEEKE